MAAPGFSINDLIDASIQVKVIYNAFFSKDANTLTQVTDLINEIDRFAANLERNKASFERAGLEYDDFDAIYKTLHKCDVFLDKYKSVLGTKPSPAGIWRTARFPYAKEHVQDLRNAIQAHKTDLMQRSVLHMMEKSTTPNNGLVDSQSDEIAIAYKRRETINVGNFSTYPVSPSANGLQIPDNPFVDSTTINNNYAYTTTPVSLPKSSPEMPGYRDDRRDKDLSPHLPSSSYGLSPQQSPELASTNTFRYSLSPCSSPVPPQSTRLSGTPSSHGSLSELILPQPALDYVVANLWFGSKTVELKRRPAGRPFKTATSSGRELVIIDEKNDERLNHRIKLSPKQNCYPYTWNSRKHRPLEVTFKGIPEGDHSIQFKGRPIDLNSHIPTYIFSNIADFTDFQSAVRGKTFVAAFAFTKISCETSTKYGDATDQHVKIWRDRDTRQCSLSYYASILKRARDLEFPFRSLRKEIERTKRPEELILRFDPTPWSQQQRRADPSSIGDRTPWSVVAAAAVGSPPDSEFGNSRHATFGTLNSVSTDRTASTAATATTSSGFFNFSRTQTAASTAPSVGSDSGNSVTSGEGRTSSLEELTRKMKFLKITFPDVGEANRFLTAYKTALANTPSQPIDFHPIDWRAESGQKSSPARLPSMSAPVATGSVWSSSVRSGTRVNDGGSNGNGNTSVQGEGTGSYSTSPSMQGQPGYSSSSGGGGGTYVEMDAAAKLDRGNGYSAELDGGRSTHASEMSGGASTYSVELEGVGVSVSSRYSKVRATNMYTAELEGGRNTYTSEPRGGERASSGPYEMGGGNRYGAKRGPSTHPSELGAGNTYPAELGEGLEEVDLW